MFDRFSKEFMKKAGFSEFTAPAELNESELKILGLETAELTVYGYRPVMISAQCIMKTRRKMYKKLFLYADERQDRRRVSRSKPM